MPELLEAYIGKKLQQREDDGNKRSLFLKEGGIDFFSNDYLGIATGKVLENVLSSYAYGATGSRLLSGNTMAAEELEQYLAAYHETEAALLFNSGYDANLGLVTALANRHTTILYDEYVHASIIDGVKLSHARQAFRFRHNDLQDLERKLQQYSDKGPVLLIAESVYSMEGDRAPLVALARLAATYDAALIIDEAHSTGIFGNKGEGLVQELQLQSQVFARVHTFGKAMGCHGAVVAGSNALKEYLLNYARSFIYTTALPEQSVMTIRRSYEWLEQHNKTRQYLHQLITLFRQHKTSYGSACWLESDTPIQSLILGQNATAKKLAAYLQQQGIKVAAVTPPTVPEGSARIRICLHAFNTEEEINILFNSINKWYQLHP